MKAHLVPVLSLAATLLSAKVLLADSVARRDQSKCIDTIIVVANGRCEGLLNYQASCNAELDGSCCTTTATCTDNDGGYSLDCQGVHVCSS